MKIVVLWLKNWIFGVKEEEVEVEEMHGCIPSGALSPAVKKV